MRNRPTLKIKDIQTINHKHESKNYIYKENVLNAGEVSLIEYIGNDLSIVNAARVSFASYDTEMTERSEGLINYLIKNKHATPFEHAVFKFHVKCPIFIAREWFRHRWSSFNEMSMRYHVPEKLEFFIPETHTIRKQVGKPGAYFFESFTDTEVIADEVEYQFGLVYTVAEKAYRTLLEKGVAKELARSVLPVGQYTEFIWTVNARSLMNFLSLRNDSHAQYEIAAYAEEIEMMFASCLPSTYTAWIQNGREAI
jgi:thymidylate synthase (FAD)